MSRLVVVFGYSDRSAVELHPVCAARLARAHAEARPDDIVLFSGWARRGLPAAEADLMASSWTAPIRSRLVDRSARTTLGNVSEAVGASARNVPWYTSAVVDLPPLPSVATSAQITALYDKGELVGRQVIAVVNFPAKQIGPFRSEVLVTGFHDEQGRIVLARPERAVPDGAKLL